VYVDSVILSTVNISTPCQTSQNSTFDRNVDESVFGLLKF